MIGKDGTDMTRTQATRNTAHAFAACRAAGIALWLTAGAVSAQTSLPDRTTASPTAQAVPAASATPPPAPPAVAAKTVPVVITTASGAVTVAVEVERAPVTASNFLRYVDARRLDGVTLYRAVKVQPGMGLVQGGAQNDPKRLFPPIAHEPTSRTGLSHTDGAISMARAAPGSATADFFFVIGNFPSMDAQPGGTGDDARGFAVFGHVVSGMDVLRGVLDAPTSPDKGEGAMKGTMLASPIRILSARRAPGA
jgi:peptidyl-prolyl cis-trans isomerase A (cyclophilin A)